MYTHVHSLINMTVEVYKHFFAKYNQKKFITRTTTIKKLKKKLRNQQRLIGETRKASAENVRQTK